MYIQTHRIRQPIPILRILNFPEFVEMKLFAFCCCFCQNKDTLFCLVEKIVKKSGFVVPELVVRSREQLIYFGLNLLPWPVRFCFTSLHCLSDVVIFISKLKPICHDCSFGRWKLNVMFNQQIKHSGGPNTLWSHIWVWYIFQKVGYLWIY